MNKKHIWFALPALLTCLSGCATLGTNIAGDFSCRAPKGGCAPTGAIDAAATTATTSTAAVRLSARPRTGIASDDISRTGERTLKIVFPAYIDGQGTLREEAVAWAVVEHADWAAALRRKPADDSRTQKLHRRQRADVPQPHPLAAVEIMPDTDPEPVSEPAYSDALLFPLVSPLVLPSTAREAIAGASAPAVEGFDMSSPLHVRTPRSSIDAALQNYPSLEAIDAAKSRSKAGADALLKEPR